MHRSLQRGRGNMVTAFPIPMSDIRRRKRADDRLLLILLLAPDLRRRIPSAPL
jgi:hypothetical protein